MNVVTGPQKGRLLSCGESAVLVEVADLDAVLVLEALVRERLQGRDRPWSDVLDVVPAARTLLVTVRPGSPLEPLREVLGELLPSVAGARPPAGDDAHVVHISVVYDGPDLADVARMTGLSPADVVAAHTGTRWQVAFGGFAPGFAYLTGGDPRLEVPRRGEPRTRVPSGSVGLAGIFSGVYPRSSPGGWQLIGSTQISLWDVDRDPPALLTPGSWVQFEEAAGDAP